MTQRSLPAAATDRGDFLSGLSAESLAALQSSGVRKRVPAGTHLTRADDQSDSVHVIMSGFVSLEVASRISQARQIAGVRVAGELVGEVEVFGGGPRAYSAITASPCDVVTVKGAEFRALIDSNREICRAFLRQTALSQRAALTARQVLGAADATERVAGVLLELARSPMAAHTRLGPVVMRIKQDDLAAMCGISRRSTARALTELRDRRLVKTGYGEIRIPSLSGLEALRTTDAPAEPLPEHAADVRVHRVVFIRRNPDGTAVLLRHKTDQVSEFDIKQLLIFDEALRRHQPSAGRRAARQMAAAELSLVFDLKPLERAARRGDPLLPSYLAQTLSQFAQRNDWPSWQQRFDGPAREAHAAEAKRRLEQRPDTRQAA